MQADDLSSTTPEVFIVWHSVLRMAEERALCHEFALGLLPDPCSTDAPLQCSNTTVFTVSSSPPYINSIVPDSRNMVAYVAWNDRTPHKIPLDI